MADLTKALITYTQLKNVVKQLVRTGYDAVLKTVRITNSGNTGEDVGITLGHDDDLNMTVTSGTGSKKVTRTVATCEDEEQKINAKAVIAGCLEGHSGGRHVVMAFPGLPLPEGYSSYDSEYRGEIVTTRTKYIETSEFHQSGVSGDNITMKVGTYNVGTGTRFRFTNDRISEYNSTNTHEYWLDLTIPVSSDPDDISITFAITGLVWAPNEPDWKNSSGCQFQIHIIGNIARVVSKRRITPSQGPQYQPTEVTGGSLERAVVYAESHSDEMFQWLLRDTTEDGYDVVKPIWHTGNGEFIDAFGYILHPGSSIG